MKPLKINDKEELKKTNTKKDDDIINNESVEQTKSDHVDETQTHGESGRHDPAQQNLNNNNLENNKVYRYFASKKELSEYIDKKVKNISEQNSKLKKELEQIKNAKKKSFIVEEKTKKQTPKIKIFGVI